MSYCRIVVAAKSENDRQQDAKLLNEVRDEKKSLGKGKFVQVGVDRNLLFCSFIYHHFCGLGRPERPAGHSVL